MTFASERGRIVPPNLDDRTWQDLVDEMRALIPQYAKAWTDQNPSDIGIALIELFAWLVESVIYRLNRVPEKNYLAFVNLLGITRNPASPARTYLRFTCGPDPVTVPAGTQAQTPAREGETPIVFETDEDVRVLPTTLRTAVLVGPTAAGTSYVDVSVPVVGPPADKYSLEVPANQTVQLCLGFDQPITEEIQLGLRLFLPAGDTDAVTASWVYSQGQADPLNWPPIPALKDGTGALRHDGTVRLMVPGVWGVQRPSSPVAGPPPDHPDAPTWAVPVRAATTPVTDARFWVGLRLANGTASPLTVGIDRVLFNAALAHTALTIRSDEILGTSDGTPFQTFALRNRPLFRRADTTAPYQDLVVQVGTGNPPVWQTWTLVEDPPADADTVYWLDPVTGEIRFGSRDRTHPQGHGSIPAPGASIQARYRYVSVGAAGNLAAGQVSALGTTISGTPPPGITNVINLGPGQDGADEETVEDTLRRAPEHLKIRDRAVTVDDYEFLTRQATTDVAICRCLAPQLKKGADPPDAWSYASINRSPGVVNVLIVPDQGLSVARPEPTPDLVREVKGYLDQRRDLAIQLEVSGPRYLPVIVTAELMIWPLAAGSGVDETVVHDQTLAKIATFLHPTRGGPAGEGWQVGQPVFSSDLFQAIMPAADVGYIASLQIAPGTPLYDGNRPFPLGAAGASVRVADYELICNTDAAKHQIKVTVAPN